ncbi:hypothetical protein PkoCFBP13504_26530 [Pseudomonas koreensis]|nr:hypothetical protein PkoCFBP13504_26530 [Pseudomonas koreensis]
MGAKTITATWLAHLSSAVPIAVGASLLAKAVSQSTSMLKVSPYSRAGSLPHRDHRFCAEDVTGNGRTGVLFSQFASNRVDSGIKR